MDGGLFEGLARRLAGASRLRAAWTRDIQAETARVRRELDKQARHEREAQRLQVEQLEQSIAALERSLAEAIERHARAERRASRFMLTLSLNDKQRDHLARLPDLLERSRVDTHVREAIARSTIIEDPFPHMVVEDVVPLDVYRMMLRAIPPLEFFGDKDPIKQNLRIPIDSGPELSTRVWRFVDDIIARDTIVPAVVARFGQHLARYYDLIFGEGFAERAAALPQAPSGGRVMLRRSGYHLAPHRDPKRSMLTCLMYLAEPGDDETHGTQIFRVTGDRESSYTQTYYPEEAGARCELVKVVPFRPNSMLVFLNGTGAHGADISADAPADLERLSYQFYVGPSAESLAALVAELPIDRQDMWREKRVSAEMEVIAGRNEMRLLSN